jgi:hypothetical protein
MVMSSTIGFALWQKLDQCPSFTIPLDSSCVLIGWGNCLPLIFLGNVVQCHSVLCHLFHDQSDKTSLSHPSWCHEESCHFDSVPFAAIRGNIFLLTFLCLHQKVRNAAGTNFLVFQTFYHLLDHMVPSYAMCCHCPVIFQFCLMSCSIFHSFMLVEAVHRQPLWGWWAVSVFTYLQCLTCLLTLLAYMQASPYAHWSCGKCPVWWFPVSACW